MHISLDVTWNWFTVGLVFAIVIFTIAFVLAWIVASLVSMGGWLGDGRPHMSGEAILPSMVALLACSFVGGWVATMTNLIVGFVLAAIGWYVVSSLLGKYHSRY